MPDPAGCCSRPREHSEEPSGFPQPSPSGSLWKQKYFRIPEFLLPSTWEFYRLQIRPSLAQEGGGSFPPSLAADFRNG